MMIVMKPTATEEEILSVIDRIESCGARAHLSRGEEVTVIGAIGDREHVQRLGLEGHHGVEQVVPILRPYKLSSSQFRHGERTVLEVADVIQVGARNMQNYPLLAEIGRSGTPVLIKRGLSSTLEELLMAAEYVLHEGNPNVLLCERGIRTFETAYRFTLDLTAVPVLKELSHLPVIVDPSHAAGRRSLVEPLSLAAAAAGADGIIVEVHPQPEGALLDGPQALVAETFPEYLEQVERAAAVAGKVLSSTPA